MLEMFDISYDEINVIKQLWEQNRQYHEKTSEYFKELYQSISFEKRIKAFSIFDEDTMKITVAKINNDYVGYCISTAIDEKGELESIHVLESLRGSGIGKELAERHIEWMKVKNCKVMGVTVSQENESTIGFYRKLGFYPNTLYMQMK